MGFVGNYITKSQNVYDRRFFSLIVNILSSTWTKGIPILLFINSFIRMNFRGLRFTISVARATRSQEFNLSPPQAGLFFHHLARPRLLFSCQGSL
jgi:hypothetical protein